MQLYLRLELYAERPRTAGLVIQPFQTGSGNIFIWSVGPKCSVNPPLIAFYKSCYLIIYLLTSLYETHQTAKKLDMGCAAVCDKSVITGVHKTDEEKVYFFNFCSLGLISHLICNKCCSMILWYCCRRTVDVFVTFWSCCLFITTEMVHILMAFGNAFLCMRCFICY